MLSKAPPVPQATSSPAPEEQNINGQDEVQESPENPSAAAEERLHNPSDANTNIEERRELALDAEPVPAPIELPTARPSEPRVLHTPQQSVSRQADDRIFTWAAVGLTIAILVLLLKKYMKANGHGAVFIDES